ncbi:MAG: AI-2E family transporter [Candidatus Aminicenantes bacterium]|nr:AI-2E family transporter [Candidatus Aminicenantes bacterium]
MNPLPENKSIVINLNRSFIFFLFKVFIFILVALIAAWILPHSGMVLTPLILAALLSILLNPLVVMLEGRGLNRTAAVALVMGIIMLLVIWLMIFLAPAVAHEFRTIGQAIKNETPATLMVKLKTLLNKHLPLLKNPEINDQIMTKIEKSIYAMLNRSIQLIPTILPLAISLFLIPFMTFFLLKDGRRLKKSLIESMPNRYFEMTISLLHKIEGQLGSYIRGQMLVSLCIGALSITALAILGVPYFLIIGALAGLANMIPYFGPIVGAVPAIILNVIDKGSLSAALVVILAFIAIRMIDDTLVSPNILGRSLEIHPLLVIIVIFIGGEMFGIMGLLLCIPVTGIIKVTIQELIWNFKHYRVFHIGA